MLLDSLRDVMFDSLEDVEKEIQKRIKAGEMKDADQSRKSTAGNNFQALVAYTLAKNIIIGNLPELYVVLKAKKHPIIEDYAIINIGDDTQKPDADIMLYREEEKSPIIVISCKTSLRERVGQTYKWKLLLDLATCKCEYIKNNNECPINLYEIKYQIGRPVYVYFITCDFYDEVNKPQQEGMFSFFNHAYISSGADKLDNKKIKKLSTITSDLNSIYAQYVKSKITKITDY